MGVNESIPKRHTGEGDSNSTVVRGTASANTDNLKHTTSTADVLIGSTAHHRSTHSRRTRRRGIECRRRSACHRILPGIHGCRRRLHPQDINIRGRELG